MEHNKLKLEDCCLTVEQAKELKVLGIDMDNPLFEYIQLVSDKQYIEEPIEKRVLGKPFLYNNTLSTLVVGGNEMYELITPTLTNSEMLEMLPKEITPMEDGYLMPYSLFYDGHSLGYNEWVLCQFSNIKDLGYIAVGGKYFTQCIPYNDKTKHLLGTIYDATEKYKTW